MNRYRLTYLGTAAVLMGGAVLVAAESAPSNGEGFNFSALFALFHSTAGASDEVNRPEPGNLSEAGAKEITSAADYLAALVVSKSQPVLVFKHSTSCEISGAAYRRTAAWLTDTEDSTAKPPVFLVKVIEHKPESELVAKQTKIEHQSPQVILLKDGKAVWTTDHENITAESIDAALETYADPAKNEQPDAKSGD